MILEGPSQLRIFHNSMILERITDKWRYTQGPGDGLRPRSIWFLQTLFITFTYKARPENEEQWQDQGTRQNIQAVFSAEIREGQDSSPQGHGEGCCSKQGMKERKLCWHVGMRKDGILDTLYKHNPDTENNKSTPKQRHSFQQKRSCPWLRKAMEWAEV